MLRPKGEVKLGLEGRVCCQKACARAVRKNPVITPLGFIGRAGHFPDGTYRSAKVTGTRTYSRNGSQFILEGLVAGMKAGHPLTPRAGRRREAW